MTRTLWILVGIILGCILGQFRFWQYEQGLQRQNIPEQLEQTPAVVIAPVDRRDGYGYLTLQLKTPYSGRLRATITPYEKYLPGDVVLVSGAAQQPTIIKSGGAEFNYPRFLARFGITKLVKRPTITKTGLIEWRWWALRWLTVSRQKLEQQINKLLPEPEAGFLAGLLLGARRSLSEETLTNLTRTGTVHIIAVSGANVVIVAGLCLQISRYLTGKRWLSFYITLLAILCFVVITGVSAAAVRGGLVASLALITTHTARGNQKLPLIIIPAALTLLVNPYFIFDLGWQFSFAAFTGIVLATPIFAGLFKKWPHYPPLISKPLVETTSANVFLSPFLVWHLNSFSFSSIIINPLVLWLIPVATVAGAAGLIISFILPLTLTRLVVWAPLHLILTIINFGAKLPWYADWSLPA